VHRYAETAGMSMSKAIAALVRLGLESQENRKREFFKWKARDPDVPDGDWYKDFGTFKL
jgi:hypothetical protein